MNVYSEIEYIFFGVEKYKFDIYNLMDIVYITVSVTPWIFQW